MKDLKFEYMKDDEIRALIGCEPDKFDIYLNVEWKGNACSIKLRPNLSRNGTLNGPMVAFFPKNISRQWFDMRNEKIHRHAHQYVLDSCDVIITCP